MPWIQATQVVNRDVQKWQPPALAGVYEFAPDGEWHLDAVLVMRPDGQRWVYPLRYWTGTFWQYAT